MMNVLMLLYMSSRLIEYPVGLTYDRVILDSVIAFKAPNNFDLALTF